MISLIYNAFLTLGSPALLLWLFTRVLKGKSRDGMAERWGHYPPELAKGERPRIWFHAASVGEVIASIPILRRVRDLLPDHEIVMSVITPGGHETALQQKGKLLDHVFYAPFDLLWVTRRAVKTIQPNIFVSLETELWPNLLSQAKKSGAKLLMVNGRISDRAIGSYLRWRFLFGWALHQFDRVLAQTERDAGRLQRIGAAKERISVFGNVKFDESAERQSPEQVAALRAELNLLTNAPIFVVGSTRVPAEEDMVLDAYDLARQTHPDLILIYAPRHVDRADDLVAKMCARGLDPVKRSQIVPGSLPVKQLVLDTFGELGRVYAVGEIAFIGNSMAAPGGGQNLLQPLAQGKPVLYGPFMQNFRDIREQAEAAKVGFTVRTSAELAGKIGELLDDKKARAVISSAALDLLKQNRGAADRYAKAIQQSATK